MSDETTREHLNSIGVVCRRTGLKSDRLRAWERRYDVVEPVRSDGNQRLYSEDDVERLTLLRRATESGHRIAQIAHLPLEELRQLIDVSRSAPSGAPQRPLRGESDQAQKFVSAALSCIQQLDAVGLRAELLAALDTLSPPAITQEILVPLIHKIGDLWAEGGLKASHEHLGTAVLRNFIEELRVRRELPPDAPRLVLTTPATERHELGALLAAATATDAGWHVTYLGPDLPAAEIAGAVRQRGAQAVGLSIVRPGDADVVREELLTLRRHLGESTGMIVGGRSAGDFEETATEAGAVLVDDLVGLAPALSLFA
jgi:DNA-binding transcriptional MerR regulator/methylmalonyl-CoA mutase cobalamin-binding subunit